MTSDINDISCNDILWAGARPDRMTTSMNFHPLKVYIYGPVSRVHGPPPAAPYGMGGYPPRSPHLHRHMHIYIYIHINTVYICTYTYYIRIRTCVYLYI